MSLFALHAMRLENQYILKQMHAARIAHHGEAEHVEDFVSAMEIKDPAEVKNRAESVRELLTDFSEGAFSAPKGSGRKYRQGRKKGLIPQKEVPRK